jgi:hypothetical protein
MNAIHARVLKQIEQLRLAGAEIDVGLEPSEPGSFTAKTA